MGKAGFEPATDGLWVRPLLAPESYRVLRVQRGYGFWILCRSMLFLGEHVQPTIRLTPV